MDLLNKTDSELLDFVTPIAKSMASAWSSDDYDNFIKYFESQKKSTLDLESFTTQRSWVAEELGCYILDALCTIHKNPTNIIVIWEVKFANRDEPGLGIYRFKDIAGEVKVSSCIYFH